MNTSLEMARLMLEKARGDLASLLRLMGDDAIPAWSLGFHAQQAVEKALKAVLNRQGIVYPRTHNLSMLLELLRQNNLALPPDVNELPKLTPYGAAFRYEDEMDNVAQIVLDRAWAARCVTQTVEWAANLI